MNLSYSGFFKMINDTYGISKADKILVEIGRRLLSIEEMGVSAFRLDSFTTQKSPPMLKFPYAPLTASVPS